MDFLIEGIMSVTWQQCVMYVIGALLIWLGIKKEYEPSLLVPMGFGAILVNFPFTAVLDQTIESVDAAGIIEWLFKVGIEASEASGTGQASAPILHLSVLQRPVFLINSRLGLFTAASVRRHPFFRSYGVNMPSSLTTLLPLALGFSPHLPVSVCGTGAFPIHIPFLAACFLHFPTIFQSLSPGATNARDGVHIRVSILNRVAATESLPCVHRLRLSASP